VTKYNTFKACTETEVKVYLFFNLDIKWKREVGHLQIPATLPPWGEKNPNERLRNPQKRSGFASEERYLYSAGNQTLVVQSVVVLLTKHSLHIRNEYKSE
jgi:hypothetical protein